MRFKIIDGTSSFVCEMGDSMSVKALYDEVEKKAGGKRHLFKGTVRSLVERSDLPISEVFSNLECIYADSSAKIAGPVETNTCTFFDKSAVFSIMEVPSDNSCLFHALSELLSAKNSDSLRKMVADEIMKSPKSFAPYIEKEPFAYSTWIVQPHIWGGATEITVISKIYETKVCVIDKDLRTYEFGEAFRSVVYLCYSGTHYNAVISKDRNGNIVRKFPYGDKKAESLAKEAVKNFFTA
ncbi:ubiquitin thioesterase OTU1 [Nematocida major]|uniref:ubiquitin thioesterase OTU1 n=1 Tax=Nematocida major TaxID=1912982 RepID=UPI0020086E65|nr:ubiquitin thioesterase OTU1 [Nematocida major]KAH9387223.1 ubiquitin thioesterase OTU1 [Nematocida major]